MNLTTQTKAIVNLALAAGYRVFVAQSGNYYGFITDGQFVMGFEASNRGHKFGGQYRAQNRRDALKVGGGWRIIDDMPTSKEDIVTLFEAAKMPPRWATGNVPVKLTTLEQHLDRFQASSKFIEVKEGKLK